MNIQGSKDPAHLRYASYNATKRMAMAPTHTEYQTAAKREHLQEVADLLVRLYTWFSYAETSEHLVEKKNQCSPEDTTERRGARR